MPSISSPVFLDSNVYLGYAMNTYLETFHNECCLIFDGLPNDRHTSDTVKREIKKKVRKRKEIYSEFLEFCNKRSDPSAFDLSKYNDNDASHMMKLILMVKTIDPNTLQYIRRLGTILEVGVQDGLSKTKPPFIPVSENDELKILLSEGTGIHIEDARIIVDYLDWGLKIAGSHFISSDNEIHDKRVEVLRFLEGNFTQQTNKFSFLHLRDVAGFFTPQPNH
jgi:hypothetical protein